MTSEKSFLKAGMVARSSLEFAAQILLTWRTVAAEMAVARMIDGDAGGDEAFQNIENCLAAIEQLKAPLALRLVPLPWEVFLTLAIPLSADPQSRNTVNPVEAATAEIRSRLMSGQIVMPSLDPERIRSSAFKMVRGAAAVWKTAAAINFALESLSSSALKERRLAYLRYADTVDDEAPNLPIESFQQFLDSHPDHGFADLGLEDSDAKTNVQLLVLPKNVTMAQINAVGKTRPSNVFEFISRLFRRK